MKKVPSIFVIVLILILFMHLNSFAEKETELQLTENRVASEVPKNEIFKPNFSEQTIQNQTNSILSKNIDNAINQIDERIIKGRITVLEWWSFISGLASIVGLLSAFFFYWKSKKTDEVARGFFSAISAESHSILEELNGIKQISNSEAFSTLKAKVETAHSFMASLNHTISVFSKTLWP